MREHENLESHLDLSTPNPCGLSCIPFNSVYCMLNDSGIDAVTEFNNTAKRINNSVGYQQIVNILCRSIVDAQNNAQEAQEANDRVDFWKSVADSVTEDKLTGLLTGNGLTAIIDEMYKPKLLKKLLDNNYYLQIIYADINDLKKHNSGPGGHHQGDLAIKIVGETLNKFAKRGRRSREILNSQDDRRDTLQVPRTIAARSNEGGDEFIVLNIKTRKNHGVLENAKSIIDEAMSNMHYEYEGNVYAVTATYGMSEVKFPRSKEELSEVIKKIDVGMMEEKQKSKDPNAPKSTGVIVKIKA